MPLPGMSTPPSSLPLCASSLGVLSIHLDGAPCRVGCEFCYLGARAEARGGGGLDLALVEELLGRLEYEEVAVAVSEPGAGAVGPLRAIVAAATARGRPVAITTTAAVLAAAPALVEGTARVNLSIDPRKGPVSPRAVERAAAAARALGPPPPKDGGAEGPRSAREVALIVSLTSPEFAERLVGGLLDDLLALPSVDKVALNALKPPPPWCGRAFWLRTCARLAPLLERHLDRRLFLDCWVACRILGLGGCPARPDVSPGPSFRSCVYQPEPDLAFATVDELAAHLARFTPPERCPFPIPP